MLIVNKNIEFEDVNNKLKYNDYFRANCIMFEAIKSLKNSNQYLLIMNVNQTFSLHFENNYIKFRKL